MSQKNNIGMMVAIIFASTVISGSLVFFGLQLKGGGGAAGNLDGAIEKGIQNYIDKQQQGQEAEAQKTQEERELSVGKLRIVDDTDHLLGSKDAEISLIEYSDFDCPFCDRVHPTLHQLVKDYDGKVNWIYRNFPLPGHDPSATAKAVAAECVAKIAGNDSYWKFVDELFARQAEIKGTVEVLTTEAAKYGVSGAAFAECFNSDAIKVKVAAQLAEGSIAGVTGTPGTIILNNKTGEKRMIDGAQPVTLFKSRIDTMLK